VFGKLEGAIGNRLALHIWRMVPLCAMLCSLARAEYLKF
jgi:hypothetical protein